MWGNPTQATRASGPIIAPIPIQPALADCKRLKVTQLCPDAPSLRRPTFRFSPLLFRQSPMFGMQYCNLSPPRLGAGPCASSTM